MGKITLTTDTPSKAVEVLREVLKISRARTWNMSSGPESTGFS